MDIPVLVALAAIVFFGILGFKDGVVKRILEILGVLLTLVLTARFATVVHPFFMETTGMDEGPALLLAWGLLFFAGLFLSRLVATLISKALRLTILGWLDKWGGAIVGMALGILITSVLLVGASQVPGGDSIQEAYGRTPVGRFIYYAAPSFYQQVRELGGGRMDEVWDRVLDTAGKGKDKIADEVEKAAREAAKE